MKNGEIDKIIFKYMRTVINFRQLLSETHGYLLCITQHYEFIYK